MKMSGEEDFCHLKTVYELLFTENRNSLVAYKSMEELLKEFLNAQAGLLFVDSELVAYSSFKVWNSCVEMMSLVVKHEFRGKGLATKLRFFVLQSALKTFPDKSVVSLPNEYSVNIVERNGFVSANKLTMPMELRESCVNCLEESDFPDCHCFYYVLPK
ncbi:GNAT family N-acetyltransferase [Candidatus Falkowbacteria bacterium]|nr:GNAT family N-acetyltransferase [Candidatus Falkowbacteria bacterium]